MHVVVHIKGRDAVPVRAVLLATVGNVTPQGLALELSKPDAERRLTAYRLSQGAPAPVRADVWDMQHEILTGIVRDFKRQEPQSVELEKVEHRPAAWRKSLEALPAGVFVWLDELENWYSTTLYSPNSVWDEQPKVVGEDDDPTPTYQLRPAVGALDLFPIAMADCEELILQGFESCPATPAGTLLVWTEERKADARAYRAEHGLKKTAEHFGVSQATISKHIPTEKAKKKAAGHWAGLAQK